MDIIKDELHIITIAMLATEVAVWRNNGEVIPEQVKKVMNEFYGRASEEIKKRAGLDDENQMP